MIDRGYTGVRHGALTVMETVRDRHEVNRALQDLNPHLFIEKQLTIKGESVWCVVLDGRDQGYIVLHEHRDPQGLPIPELTWAVVDEMKRRYERGPVGVADAIAANDAKREAAAEERREVAMEIAREHHALKDRALPSLMGGSPKVLQSRRRDRAEGRFEKAGQ